MTRASDNTPFDGARSTRDDVASSREQHLASQGLTLLDAFRTIDDATVRANVVAMVVALAASRLKTQSGSPADDLGR